MHTDTDEDVRTVATHPVADGHRRLTTTARSALLVARDQGDQGRPEPGHDLVPLPIGAGEAEWLRQLGRLREAPAALAAVIERYRFHLNAAGLGPDVDRRVLAGISVAVRLGTVLDAMREALDGDDWRGKCTRSLECPDDGRDHLGAILALCLERDAVSLGRDPTELVPV